MSAERSRRPLPRLLLAAGVCLLLGAAGGVLAAVLTSQPEPVRASFTPPREPPPTFRLRDQDGKWVATPQDSRGKVLVLTFLYSTCHDLCPAQAGKIAQAVGEVGGKGVRVIGVSVDPTGDTPERARAFLKRFQLYGGPVSFLIGSRQELAPVWASYGIVPVAATGKEAEAAAAFYDQYREERSEEFAKESGGEEYTAAAQAEVEGAPKPTTDGASPKAAEDPYPAREDFRYRGRRRHYALDFEHSAYVLLIDKHGRQRVGFPFEQLDAKLLAGDIRALQAER